MQRSKVMVDDNKLEDSNCPVVDSSNLDGGDVTRTTRCGRKSSAWDVRWHHSTNNAKSDRSKISVIILCYAEHGLLWVPSTGTIRGKKKSYSSHPSAADLVLQHRIEDILVRDIFADDGSKITARPNSLSKCF
ncbi:hypothetical protein ACJJTC_019552 [Scirpophaga incertulas]